MFKVADIKTILRVKWKFYVQKRQFTDSTKDVLDSLTLLSVNIFLLLGRGLPILIIFRVDIDAQRSNFGSAITNNKANVQKFKTRFDNITNHL